MPRMLYIFTTAYVARFFQRGQNAYLKKHGFEFHLAATRDSHFDVVVERDGMIPHPVTIKRKPSVWHDLIALFRLIYIIREVRPDIIHVATPKGSLLGLLAAFFFKRPAKFFMCHGSISSRKIGFGRRFYQLCEMASMRIADQVCFVSSSLMNYMRSEEIISQDKGIMFRNGTPNGVKKEWLYQTDVPVSGIIDKIKAEKANHGYQIAGFVGRLGSSKGLNLIAEAWSKLRIENPEWRLMLVGEWDSVHPLADRVKKLLLDDERVFFTGFVDSRVVGHVYDLMDFLLMPSEGEGFGMVILEAALAGVPTIATNVLGCTDAVLDGVTGTLIQPRNADALLLACKNYFDNPATAKNHGLAAKKRAEQDYIPEEIWEETLQEYQQLLEKHN